MDLSEKLKQLPDKSGVYIMYDASGKIIYIGKAVVLKNRVRQYFQSTAKPPKVEAMVASIANFEYIITLSEMDALALESNLIKKHKPKYNILLKDDKASPYIRINSKVDFPTIEVVRRLKRDGAKYYGPYFNGVDVQQIVGILRSAYQIRTCAVKFSSKRVCLNYHIKLCDGACCGLISREDYAAKLSRAMSFLSGHDESAYKLVEKKMEQAVAAEEFERAITYRDQLKILDKMKEKSIVNLGQFLDIDVLGYATDGEYSVVSVLMVRGGKMLGMKNYPIVDATIELAEVLSNFALEYYTKNNEVVAELVLPQALEDESLIDYLHTLSGIRTHITVPQKGVKKQLLMTATDNARDYLVKSVGKLKHEEDMTVGAVRQLCKILALPSADRIECFDISNISGTDKVASMVVFERGAANKSAYRKFKIKTVEGSDDFKSMQEVIRRRFERAKSDDKFSSLPDLIVVDGGKGQVSSAYESMTLCGYDIPMIGLAERNEEIFTVGATDPIVLSRDNNALKLLVRVRDEAHRFAITYHRNLRSKNYLSQLDEIKGVGAAKRKILLESFETIGKLKAATVSELKSIKGIDEKTAQAIYLYFHEKD